MRIRRIGRNAIHHIEASKRAEELSLLAIAPRADSEASALIQKECFARMREALERAGFAFSRRELDGGASARERSEALLGEAKPDLAFCSFYDRGIYDVLAKRRILFVGSPGSALELCLSKSRLKRVWGDRGIASPSSFRVRRTRTGAIAGRKLIGKARDFPYIVKPDGEDDNRGIHARSIAFDAGSLAACIDSSLEEYDDLIVEHFVGGASSREYTVAMIGNGKKALMLPAEISLKERRPIKVVTREDRERGLAVAVPVGSGERERIEAFARRAFAAAGVRDYARCDLIDEAGSLFALEVNGQPRMPDPWFEACAAGGGMAPDQYVVAIALAALLRGSRTGLGLDVLPSRAREFLPAALLDRLMP